MYTLNLHNVVCQLYLNKAGKIKNKTASVSLYLGSILLKNEM